MSRPPLACHVVLLLTALFVVAGCQQQQPSPIAAEPIASGSTAAKKAPEQAPASSSDAQKADGSSAEAAKADAAKADAAKADGAKSDATKAEDEAPKANADGATVAADGASANKAKKGGEKSPPPEDEGDPPNDDDASSEKSKKAPPKKSAKAEDDSSSSKDASSKDGKKDAKTTKTKAKVAPSTKVKVKSSGVKLLARGKKPRRELRLSPSLGLEEQMQMSINMSIGMKVGKKEVPAGSLPPMLVTMAMKVTDKEDDGDIRYEFTMTDTDVLPAKGIPPKIVDAMRSSLARLKGLKGHAVVTDRGINKEAKLELPKKADAQTKQVMQGMEQAIHQIGVPLPKKAIGVGAKWQHVTKLTQNGISMTQIATYQLVKLADDKVTCKVTIKQKAKRQKVVAPGGIKVDLLGLKSSGKGNTIFLLGGLAPMQSTLSLESKVKMGLDKKQTMLMTTAMTVDVVAIDEPPKKGEGDDDDEGIPSPDAD